MKVIDLLNKIANDKGVPKEIRYEGTRYYYCEEDDLYKSFGIYKEFPCLYLKELNNEIEIIEDEAIKKVDRQKCVDFADTLEKTLDKLDEIIDKLNEGENE